MSLGISIFPCFVYSTVNQFVSNTPFFLDSGSLAQLSFLINIFQMVCVERTMPTSWWNFGNLNKYC